jgi:hypothetical protein
MPDIPRFCERIAKERNCSPELVRAIVGDYMLELHKAAFQQGIGMALWAAYSNIDARGAWHFGCLLADAADGNEPGELMEHYQRLDSSMRRFVSILDEWKVEQEFRQDPES